MGVKGTAFNSPNGVAVQSGIGAEGAGVGDWSGEGAEGKEQRV